MNPYFMIYFISTSLNIWILKMAAQGPLFSFMTIRSFTALVLVLSVAAFYRLAWRELFSQTAIYRFGVGGIGLSLQLIAAQFLPVSTLAFTNRSIPIWLTLLIPNKLYIKTVAIIFLMILLLLIVLNHGFLAVIALISPLLLALSQIKQSQAAKTETSVLLP